MPDVSSPTPYALSVSVEKLLLAAGIFVVSFSAYFVVGLTTDRAHAHELFTSLDARIPFAPLWVHPYALVFTAAFYPGFCITSRTLFRRTALAYVILVAATVATFVLFPVTSAHLRADANALDPSSFSEWGLRLIYSIDPPFNQFPSLHMGAMTLCALAAGRARPLWGWLGLPAVLAVAIAICAVKQHFVLDGVAGALLAVGVYRVIVHPWSRAASDDAPASSWRGPVAFLGMHAAAYAAIYAAFVMGWRPF